MSRRTPSSPASGFVSGVALERASGLSRTRTRAQAGAGTLVLVLVLTLVLVLASASAPALCAQDKAPAAFVPSPELFAGGRTEVAGNLSARLSMRKVPYAQVLAEKALVLPKSPQNQDGARLWPLSPALGDADPRAFGEVRLDTLGSSRAGQDLLGLVATLGGPGGKTVFASDPLEAVRELTPAWADGQAGDHVEVAGADWTPKSLRYQLSRLLDRAPDSVWRYAQDGLSTFVQRRFRKQLAGVGAVDVVLARGQSVQVNLVVAPNPAEPRRTVVLDWYALNKRFFDLGDGRRVLRLYVGRRLAELYPGAKSVLLKEIALMFFKKDQAAVLAERGVERIVFAPSGLPPGLLAESGLPRFLPARSRELFAGRNELTVSLAPFSAPPYDAMAVTGLEAVQSGPGASASGAKPENSPQAESGFQGATLEAVSLVRTAPRREVAALLAATAERCRTIGAACNVLEREGLVSQEPLWSVSCLGLAGGGQGDGAKASRTLAPVGLAGLFGPAGVEFVQAPDGLGVRAQGSVILETGAAFTPDPNRVYSLWLELGPDTRGLAGVEVVAYGGGRESRLAVKPGFAAVFVDLPPRVEGVRVRFLASGKELGFTLRRASLQSVGRNPVRVGLFSATYLFDQLRPLAVTPAGERGARLRSPAGGPFAAQWLRLRVSTAPWTVADRPPVLEISLPGSVVAWPLPGPEADLAVYLPGVMRDVAGAAGPGAGAPRGAGNAAIACVTDLCPCMPNPGAQPAGAASPGASSSGATAPGAPSVEVRLVGGAEGAALTVTDARISGEWLTTWPRMLEEDPLLTLAGRPYSLADLGADQATAMAERNAWLPLGPARLTPGDDAARFARNPWLDVEALMLADADGPRLDALGRELPAAPAKAGKGAMLFRLAGAAGLLGLCWLAGRKGRAASLLAWAGRALVEWLSRERTDSGDFLACKGWVLAGLGLAVAAVFLGPGAGRGALFAASLLAVPLWRAARARLAGGLFGRGRRLGLMLTREAWRFHLAGFSFFAGLGALVRLTGAPVIPELFGLGGLWLLLTALLLHLRQPSGADA